MTREPKIGDVVWYRTFGGELRQVKVTGIDREGKNGRLVFDGQLMGDGNHGKMVWGYFGQIGRIE